MSKDGTDSHPRSDVQLGDIWRFGQSGHDYRVIAARFPHTFGGGNAPAWDLIDLSDEDRRTWDTLRSKDWELLRRVVLVECPECSEKFELEDDYLCTSCRG